MRQFFSNGSEVEAVAILPPISNTFNATLNSSNKVFTVPTGEVWKLNFAHITFISDATVGNRQMTMEISDSSANLMISVAAGATQAASLTREYHYLQGTFRETAFVASELQTPFGGDIYMNPGWTIRFRDSAAIAAATDDMTVAMQVQKFNI